MDRYTSVGFDGSQVAVEANLADGTVVRTTLPLANPTQQANAATLKTKAQQALAVNSTFLALASPTNAQTLAQVQLLTKECNGIIRLLLGQFDTTAGT